MIHRHRAVVCPTPHRCTDHSKAARTEECMRCVWEGTSGQPRVEVEAASLPYTAADMVTHGHHRLPSDHTEGQVNSIAIYLSQQHPLNYLYTFPSRAAPFYQTASSEKTTDNGSSGTIRQPKAFRREERLFWASNRRLVVPGFPCLGPELRGGRSTVPCVGHEYIRVMTVSSCIFARLTKHQRVP
jgi:hypothetical protein